LKICHIFNINCIHFETVRRRTEMMLQQRASRPGSRAIECAVGESSQSSPLAFVLKENIMRTCSNKDGVM